MPRASTRSLVALALALAASPAAAQGSKHALLVGVGRYTHLPQATLEGPPHDLAALRKALTERWGFPPGNVTVLQDAEATKGAILSAVDALATTSRPGDFVFVYFSGHGTSGYDKEFKEVGIDGASGALIPADFKPGPPQALKDGLIIGSRDLKPRFLQLDRDRKLFVAFDSCFSGNAARSLFAAGKERYVPVSKLVAAGSARALGSFGDEEQGSFGAQTARDAPYPYSNLVYVSAASKAEKAMDIDSSALQSGRVQTVDGQPHGAMTNALLLGLSGAANTNQDASITYGELYQFVKDRVTQGFPHQPQLLAPEGGALLQQPILGGGRAAAPARPPQPPPTASASVSTFRVKLDQVAPAVARGIEAQPGVRLTTGAAYDLLVVQGPQGFKLVHGSGDVLASYGPEKGAEVAARVGRQVAVAQLVDLDFPGQDFNVTVTVPGNRGFLRRGEPFTIEFTSERDAHLLLFDVDNEGYVTVLYPYDAAEMRPTRRGRIPSDGGELKVSPPFGTDYLKLVAFRQKPAGFERWKGADDLHLSPTGPELGQLLQMIRSAPGGKAQARLKIVTQG